MSRSVASLDDETSSAASSYDEEEYLLAQQEWEESIKQLQQLFGVVLLPFVGKWLGRRCSHLLYSRYISVGLGTEFFFGQLFPKSRPPADTSQ